MVVSHLSVILTCYFTWRKKWNTGIRCGSVDWAIVFGQWCGFCSCTVGHLLCSPTGLRHLRRAKKVLSILSFPRVWPHKHFNALKIFSPIWRESWRMPHKNDAICIALMYWKFVPIKFLHINHVYYVQADALNFLYCTCPPTITLWDSLQLSHGGFLPSSPRDAILGTMQQMALGCRRTLSN